MDYSAKDYLDNSLSQSETYYPRRRSSGVEEIISPKRGLGKKISKDSQEDGLFRKPSPSGFKLPFFGSKKVVGATGNGRRSSR